MIENSDIKSTFKKKMHRITKFKTKKEAVANINKGDRLFYDPYLYEYFIISPREYIWKEGEFEENFMMMPETFEECMRLRPDYCRDCEYFPNRISYKSCLRKTLLLNRERMEIFDW